MIWTSPEGKALLWAAYPEGYLAMRGVKTLGGWQYVSGKGTDGQWVQVERPWDTTTAVVLSDSYMACLSAGSLLPLPDPTDVATWACLLVDLAKATGKSYEVGLCLVPTAGGWDLRDSWIQEDMIFSELGTTDPAEALIRVRASLR